MRFFLPFLMMLALFAIPPAALGDEKSPTLPNKEPLLRTLLPSPYFQHGQKPGDILKIARERFSLWSIDQQEQAINPGLPADPASEAKTSFLYRIALDDQTKDRAFDRSYRIYLTSSLSGNEVFSIVYTIKPRGKQASLLKVDKVLLGLGTWLGTTPYFTDDRTQKYISYFYGADGKLLGNVTKCGLILESISRLTDRSPEYISAVMQDVRSTNCYYSFEMNIKLNDDKNIISSTVYFADHMRQLRDALKRVTYGRPETSRPGQ